MGTLIDSSVVIAIERGELEPEQVFGQSGEELAISSITAAEILQGLHRASRAHRARRDAFVEGFLAEVPILAFDLRVARVFARLWADLPRSGVVIGERDLMIASTALAHGFRVATRDLRSFRGIPGLKVIEL